MWCVCIVCAASQPTAGLNLSALPWRLQACGILHKPVCLRCDREGMLLLCVYCRYSVHQYAAWQAYAGDSGACSVRSKTNHKTGRRDWGAVKEGWVVRANVKRFTHLIIIIRCKWSRCSVSNETGLCNSASNANLSVLSDLWLLRRTLLHNIFCVEWF